MTDRELMRQVLDALDSDNPDIQLRTAVALRNRMSQPEPLFSTPDVTPEVTPHVIDCPRCGHCCPQPNQEPVKDKLDFWALFDENQRLRAELKFNTTPPAAQPEQNCVGWFGYDTGVRAWFETNKGDDDSIPLYKDLRQWVGLTDEEIKFLPSWWPSYEDAPALIELVKDVEAKLKEKNCG